MLVSVLAYQLLQTTHFQDVVVAGLIFDHTQNVHVLEPILFTKTLISSCICQQSIHVFGESFLQVLAVFSGKKKTLLYFASIVPFDCVLCILNFSVRRVCGLGHNRGGGVCQENHYVPKGTEILFQSVSLHQHRNLLQELSPTQATNSAWSELHLLSGGPNVCSEP